MRKWWNIFLSAVGAGLMIAIGGTVYLTLENKVIGSLMFTVGLYAIVLNALHLFTGKVGYLVNVEDKKEHLMLLIFTWAGNLVGTGIGAIAVSYTRVSGIKETAAVICGVKLNDNVGSLFILAIFCGALMYIAVDAYREKGNPIILFLCVSVFILSGFEHCIANMFYFSLAGVWSAKAVGLLIVMTLGNAVGGMLLPAIKLVRDGK